MDIVHCRVGVHRCPYERIWVVLYWQGDNALSKLVDWTNCCVHFFHILKALVNNECLSVVTIFICFAVCKMIICMTHGRLLTTTNNPENTRSDPNIKYPPSVRREGRGNIYSSIVAKWRHCHSFCSVPYVFWKMVMLKKIWRISMCFQIATTVVTRHRK